MAHLAKKNSVYMVRFRYNGQEFKKSLKTKTAGHAAAALRRVEDALHWLAINKLTVPNGVDAGDFIVSGGTLQEPRQQRQGMPTLQEAIQEYKDHLGHLAETNRYTIGVHLNHLKKHLVAKIGGPIDEVSNGDLDGFLEARLVSRAKATVQKERQTVLDFFDFAVARSYLHESPATNLRSIKGNQRGTKFRTIAEIEATIERGGLDRKQELNLWDCLFLSPGEISGLLQLVRQRSKSPVSFILHALAAYSGMRRGEILRLLWADVDFQNDLITARSKKQSTQDEEVQRQVDMHPELKAILLAWREQRPRGQYVVCDDGSTDPLTPNRANKRFWQPLRRTTWCLLSRRNLFKIGYHTYRHSFASNLAAAGVDQRYIDTFMGHQTEAMRRRYRHMYPKDRRSAIESFSLELPQQASAVQQPPLGQQTGPMAAL